MESLVSYGQPIEGVSVNNILDSRYAFRVLRDTQISLGKSLLPYSLQVREGRQQSRIPRLGDRNSVFLEISAFPIKKRRKGARQISSFQKRKFSTAKKYIFSIDINNILHYQPDIKFSVSLLLSKHGYLKRLLL